MPKTSIRDYLFNKLFFPKVVVIDKPGVIISKTSLRYGGGESKRRMIYFFEDIAVHLQIETIQGLGNKKTQELFYKVGKDIGTRDVLVSKAKKPSYFILSSIVDYLFRTVKAGGFSLAENIDFNPKKKSLILKGRDNMICRKSRIDGITSGLISGFISFLIGENIEAEARCYDCPNNCVVIANENIKDKYIPNFKDLKPLGNYEELNFSVPIIKTSKMYSLSELWKFKKIQTDDSGKLCFMGKMIIPTEAGSLGLIVDHFLKLNKKSILEEGLIEGAQKLAKDILKDKKTKSDKIKAIKIMLCAFGWGIPDYKKEENKIIFDFIHAPITKYTFLYEALVVNGYLNYIFNKKFKIKKTKLIGSSTIRCEYSCSQ